MSITQMAKRLGLSPATVSLALKGDPRVAEATRMRVRELAAQVGYQANEQARNLRLGRSGLVALVVWNIASDFWAGVVNAAEAELEVGSNLVICNAGGSYDKECRIVADLAARRVDGLIIQPADNGRIEHLCALEQAGTPVVLFDRVENCNLPVVKGNDLAAARKAVRLLAQAGRSRILFLSFHTEKSLHGVRDRETGFLEECKRQGISHQSKRIVLPQGSRNEIKQLVMPEIGAFDAAICVSPAIIAGLLPLLHEEKLVSPRDLALLSWDNQPFMEYLQPPITCIRIPVEQMGRQAARLIQENRRGSEASCYLEEEFIFRDSFPLPAGT